MKYIKILILSFMVVKVLYGQQPSIHAFHKEIYSQEATYNNSLSKSADIIPVNKGKIKDGEFKIFGYLPYWEYKNHSYLQYDYITHIACFDFAVDEFGNIKTPLNWPWTDFINKAHSEGIKLIMTVTNFDGNKIHTIITNKFVTQKFFDNLYNLINKYKFDGVNIDFEGVKKADRGTVINSFIAELKNTLYNKNSELEVSFAAPAINWSGWNFIELAKSCDYLFIMGYDFYGKWSKNIGPTAPLSGIGKNILTTLTDTRYGYGKVLKQYPKKILLGVPYYGIASATKDDSENSLMLRDSNNILKYFKSPRYRTAVKTYNEKGKIWSYKFKVSWTKWKEDTWYQMYCDDDSSLSLKFNLVLKHKILGTGPWAFGYDAGTDEFWNLIKEKFFNHVSIENNKVNPEKFKLLSNYPNPFNPSTNICFYSQGRGTAIITIYNALGKEIARLVKGNISSGKNIIKWNTLENGNNIPSGIYIYRVSFINNSNKVFTQNGKMCLLK